MQYEMMVDWLNSSHFASGSTYIESLYESYRDEPSSVSSDWQEIFSLMSPQMGEQEVSHSQIREQFKKLSAQKFQAPVSAPNVDADQFKVFQLIEAYRTHGHRQAKLDPLGLWQRESVPELDLNFYELSDADLSKNIHSGNFHGVNATLPLNDLLKELKTTYTGTIGVEYMHLSDAQERHWLQENFESKAHRTELSSEVKKRMFQGLNAAEGLEKYISSKFPGAKRFSLEGGDSLIPMMRELIYQAGSHGVQEAVIGMAHRGRLNVLTNILGKQSRHLFDEFAGKQEEILGSGDVKYHLGYSSNFTTPSGDMHLTLAFNPSHLEIVNPVVMGSVRARQERLGCSDGSRVLPITIHGDSAITGQGVVQETFNMSQTRGFKVGGSVRIVTNNQVGFTTSKQDDVRSSTYCTDIAKMVEAPIFHVNADDLNAVAFVTKLALEFRQKFHRDVVIDLICYRRHGHNEADEPNATQPLMYQKIKKQPTTRQLYADQLIAEQVMTKADVSAAMKAYRELLDKGERTVPEWREIHEARDHWKPFLGKDWIEPYNNDLPLKDIKVLADKIAYIPEDFSLQSRVAKLYQDRVQMAQGDKQLDWGFAENLSYASLLNEGYRIRMTGQDSGRGTFFHRHAVLHDQKTADTYMPLAHLAKEQGDIEIHDSVLSEASVLAYEYGYASTEPRSLIIWEAQFGDFANGAQVVIDQFLSSGEQKWGRLCGLTLLLPHGYEGQGPEHSSARLERYLQLCADHNMQVCIPSTPAQVYHMLRRQALRPLRRPLIVMSPKSLLRHPLAVSSLEELAQGEYQNIIDEQEYPNTKDVTRVVFCSGKVYYDLLERRTAEQLKHVALVRIEQLYPFPHEELEKIMSRYAHVNDFVWCQEEPKNQGAWYCSHHHFIEMIPNNGTLSYAGRAASASPAAGYPALHAKQQKMLVERALGLNEDVK